MLNFKLILIIIFWLMSLNIQSQQLIRTALGDTLVALSMQQGKYLLKQIYTPSEVNDLFNVTEIEKLNCDTIVKLDEIKINDYKKIIANQGILLNSKDESNKDLKNCLKESKKEIIKQKKYKWISIVCGVVFSGFLGYEFLNK